MSNKSNQYTGETIDFVLFGDDVYDFSARSSQTFKLFVYPDGLDVTLSVNQNFIKTIDSRDVEDSISHGDGYVIRMSRNEAHCILPYSVTQNMKTGHYTIEVLYGENQRSVMMWNDAFNLVLGNSKNIN